MAHQLGNNLRKLRKFKTVAEVAAKMGLHAKTYAAYERAQNEPKIETLKRMADFHNITMDQLCYGDLDNKQE